MANVKKLGEGRSARYRVKYRTKAGESRSQVFDLKREADAFAESVEPAKRKGTFTDPTRGKIDFGTLADAWLKLPSQSRPSTRARDESYLRTNIRPYFAGRRIGDLTRGDIQVWVDELTADRNLAPATVVKAHQILAKILDSAVRDERLGVNPARTLIDLPELDDAEARFLTPDELLGLEASMPDRYAVLVPFLADVGLRIGEAAGLRWRDVDTWAGTVTVREKLVEVHGKATLGAPKTRAGRRIVPTLTREVGQRLERTRGAPDAFVFASPEGGPLRPAAFRSRVWRPAVLAAGLGAPLPTPHSLRHSAVAHWIAAGVEPYKLAKWAGHRSVATIYSVYGHLLTNDATEERAALSAIRAAAEASRAESATVLPLRDPREVGAYWGRSGGALGAFPRA